MDSDRRDWEYRHYVANSLYLYSDGRRYTVTLNEIMNPKPVDTRTGAEIAVDIIQGAGLIRKE